MIELLSSSKFTAGTWEEFASCLPNMTQEIVINIKQRGVDRSNSDHISAVAKYCMDHNPELTWRSIMDASLDASEVEITQHVLDIHSGQ